MANQTKSGIDHIGLNASNIRYVAATVNAAGIAAGETFTITLPEDLDVNYVPIMLSHWRGAGGVWSPIAAGSIVVTSYTPATRTLLLTAAGAGCNAADELIMLFAATEAVIS